jgi:hypothetical protein
MSSRVNDDLAVGQLKTEPESADKKRKNRESPVFRAAYLASRIHPLGGEVAVAKGFIL